MPKIRDLGINVIPETMRPPEIGPGGGGGGGCQGATYGYPGTPQCPTTTIPTTPWWGCGFTQNCPTTTIPTTQNPQMYMQMPCPTTTIFHQSEQCYDWGSGLTREAIARLKQQLHQQIAQLDEYAKSIGPKTIEEIQKREKEIQTELEELATRRKELERNK